MNYRDFYKNNKKRPVSEEVEENLLQGLNLDEPAVDDGLPKRSDGSLDTIHDGRPIHLSKIIQIGAEFGKSADGAVSGYTNVGVDEKSKGQGDSKDGEGVPVEQSQEPLTAGGKPFSSDLASKSVGGDVVNNGGQKQGGPNTAGSIAGTPKPGEGDGVLSLQEAKVKLRSMVKEALKEISFNKETGRWERITENTDSAGFPSQGVQGRPQYKVAGPQFRVQDDNLARSRQFEPEITEMYDEEEESTMQERYTELANAQRNLSESELSELRDLGSKLEERNWMKNIKHNGACTPMDKASCTPRRRAFARRAKAGEFSENTNTMKMGPSYKEVQPNLTDTSKVNKARVNQFDPQVSEYGAPTIEPDVEPEVEPWKQPEPDTEPAPETPAEPVPQTPDPLQPERPGIAPRPRGYRTNEAGGAAVQHSSFRTVQDRPQIVKNRNRGDIDESIKKKVNELRKKDWAILNDITHHCTKNFPKSSLKQLKKVVSVLFEQSTGRILSDPNLLDEIVIRKFGR